VDVRYSADLRSRVVTVAFSVAMPGVLFIADLYAGGGSFFRPSRRSSREFERDADDLTRHVRKPCLEQQWKLALASANTSLREIDPAAATTLSKCARTWQPRFASVFHVLEHLPNRLTCRRAFACHTSRKYAFTVPPKAIEELRPSAADDGPCVFRPRRVALRFY